MSEAFGVLPLVEEAVRGCVRPERGICKRQITSMDCHYLRFVLLDWTPGHLRLFVMQTSRQPRLAVGFVVASSMVHSFEVHVRYYVYGCRERSCWGKRHLVFAQL